MKVVDQKVILTRCGTCGIFAPQILGRDGTLGKVVSMPCAHRNWHEIEYIPVGNYRPCSECGTPVYCEPFYPPIRVVCRTCIHERARLREVIDPGDESPPRGPAKTYEGGLDSA